MLTLAVMLSSLAIAGAIISWVAGAIFYARTLHALSTAPDQRRMLWLAVLAWPFAIGRLKGAAAEHAATVNKAFVAFIACLMVAVAATSVATNLARIAR
jgi:hypothetical protein